VWVSRFTGPDWGGGLHSHGLTVEAIGEYGVGGWLTPDAVRVDLAEAVQLRDITYGPDLDSDQLAAALRQAFPGAEVSFEAPDEYGDHDSVDEDQDDGARPPLLIEKELTWSCDGSSC